MVDFRNMPILGESTQNEFFKEESKYIIDQIIDEDGKVWSKQDFMTTWNSHSVKTEGSNDFNIGNDSPVHIFPKLEVKTELGGMQAEEVTENSHLVREENPQIQNENTECSISNSDDVNQMCSSIQLDLTQENGYLPREDSTYSVKVEISEDFNTHKKSKYINDQIMYENGKFQPHEGFSTSWLNKAPKTSAERGREFRARKALLKQQSKRQQEPDAIVEIATEDIRSAGPPEDNQVPGPSEIRKIEREKKKDVSESSKKLKKSSAKTAAQRMREYRERKKLAKRILSKQQSDQDLDAIVNSSSSQVNRRDGPSTKDSISAEITRRGNSQSQQQIERSERIGEYRERRNDNINIESNNYCIKMDRCDNFNTKTDCTKGKKKYDREVLSSIQMEPSPPKCDLPTNLDSVISKRKKHKCHLCAYCPSRYRDLRVHIESVHLKLKNHECKFCDFSSSRKECLQKHVKSIHLNLKNHKCDLCDYSSSQKSDLQTHLKSVHLKLKHLECVSCDYITSRKSDLKRHLKSVHLKLENHKCDLCDYSSPRKRDLENRTQSVHLNSKIMNVTFAISARHEKRIFKSI